MKKCKFTRSPSDSLRAADHVSEVYFIICEKLALCVSFLNNENILFSPAKNQQQNRILFREFPLVFQIEIFAYITQQDVFFLRGRYIFHKYWLKAFVTAIKPSQCDQVEPPPQQPTAGPHRFPTPTVFVLQPHKYFAKLAGLINPRCYRMTDNHRIPPPKNIISSLLEGALVVFTRHLQPPGSPPEVN